MRFKEKSERGVRGGNAECAKHFPASTAEHAAYAAFTLQGFPC